MIVEDEPLTRAILRARLDTLGHETVAEAENGSVAVELAKTKKPDVIIMDIRMPEMDGIEAAKLIMETSPCAILFLTAFSEHSLVEQATDAGALAYLLKPFRKEELAPALDVAVSRYRQIASKDAEIASLRETLETRKLVERAKGILMKRHNFTEEEAFKKIHFQARNQNRRMRDIAESIITAAELI
jgi:response regulator NasT